MNAAATRMPQNCGVVKDLVSETALLDSLASMTGTLEIILQANALAVLTRSFCVTGPSINYLSTDLRIVR